jgi:hypothetical protein
MLFHCDFPPAMFIRCYASIFFAAKSARFLRDEPHAFERFCSLLVSSIGERGIWNQGSCPRKQRPYWLSNLSRVGYFFQGGVLLACPALRRSRKANREVCQEGRLNPDSSQPYTASRLDSI